MPALPYKLVDVAVKRAIAAPPGGHTARWVAGFGGGMGWWVVVCLCSQDKAHVVVYIVFTGEFNIAFNIQVICLS